MNQIKCARATMAGLEDSRLKTQAQNLAPAEAILFHFQELQNLVQDQQFFEALNEEFLEKRMKMKPQERKIMAQFWDRISQNRP